MSVTQSPLAPAARGQTLPQKFAVVIFLALAFIAVCGVVLVRDWRSGGAIAHKELDPAAVTVAAGQGPNQDRMMAPELEGGVAWLNTASPLRIKDLRGKVVLLD